MQTGSEKIDVRELIDRIRRAIANRAPGEEEVLAADLATYSSLCAQANQRLRQCFELSKKGQYANALAIADQSPNLLDHCSDLEIPERDILPAVAAALHISPPEPINVTLVEALQEAYAKGNSAADNLRLLRKLTLSRAPLPARIAVMRRLLIQDPSHPYMELDIRQFETAWFNRVQDFCRSFAVKGDTANVELVLADLRNNGYLETPPKTLLSALEGQLAKARQAQLPVLAEQIRQAYAEQAVVRLQSLFVKWETLTAKAGIDPADPKHGLSDALRWLRQTLDEEQKVLEGNRARARLSLCIQDRKVARLELEQAYASASALGVVDELLQSQYRSRLSQLNRRRTVARLLVTVGSLVAISVISMGTSWWLQNRAHQNAVAQHLSELNSLAQAGNFDEVIRVNKAASRDVAADPEVTEIVQTAVENKTRLERLTQAIETITGFPLDGDIQPLIDEAHQLALTDEDKGRIDKAVEQRQKRIDQRLIASREEFAQRIADLTRSIEKAEQAQDPSASFLVQDIKTIQATVADLRTFAQERGVGQGTLPDLEKKLSLLQSRVAVANLLKDYLARHTKSSMQTPPLSEIADFLSDKLAQEAGDSQWAERLKSAKTDLPLWNNILKLRAQLLRGKFPNSADSRIWDGTPLASALGASIREAQLAATRSFQRLPGDQPATESVALLDRLTAADMQEVRCVRPAGFSYPYYTLSEVAGGDDELEIKYLIDSRGATLPVRISGTRKVFPAPQSEYLAKVLPALTNATTESWHSALVTGYSELLAAEDIDPVLRLQLLDKYLAAMSLSSTGFSELLEARPAFKAVFRSSRRVTGVWYRPEDEDKLEPLREEATKLCKSAPKLTSQDAERAQKRDARLAQMSRDCVAILGLLAPEGTSSTISYFQDARPECDGTLFVLSNKKWTEVGKVEGDSVILNKAARTFLGWPVILVARS